MSKDAEKLERITELFTKALLANEFEDKNHLDTLLVRLTALIEFEKRFSIDAEIRRIHMASWGPRLN